MGWPAFHLSPTPVNSVPLTARAHFACLPKRHAIAQSRDRSQEAYDLLGIEDRRELLGFFTGDDPLERLLLAQRNAVEETQCTRDLVDMRPRQLLGHEMQLVGADVLHPEPIRRPLEVAAKLCHRVEIRLLRRWRQIADCHVLDHALAERADRSHLGAPVLRGMDVTIHILSDRSLPLSSAASPPLPRSGFVQSAVDALRAKLLLVVRLNRMHPP